MNTQKQNQHRQLKALLAYWGKHCVLEAFHIDWAKRHLECISVSRNQLLYYEGNAELYVYFVCSGKIARIRESESFKRNILSIALPGMALMTTTHLHSSTPSEGTIVALCRSNIVRIPYAAIKEFEDQEPSIALLNRMLSNKKRRQLIQLRNISYATQVLERYTLFDRKMPEIRNATTQQEQAELLGISKSSVQKAQKILVTGKSRPK